MNEDPRVDLASLYRELMDDSLRVAGPVELESDEPAPDACDHRWNVMSDWYGTADYTFWRCCKCGEETHEQPEDWDDGPDADEWRERMEDGRLK